MKAARTPRGVELRTPCCQRKVLSAYETDSGPFSYLRKCPKCKLKWAAKVDPLNSTKHAPPKSYVYLTEWTLMAEQQKSKLLPERALLELIGDSIQIGVVIQNGKAWS